ncbi:hypothetical protein [Streptomyces sp. NBC_01565]|uniref:hypothetical protein n=1 Tax=unclassified Streptomyces TaxID=2593676 RepID=UPI00225621C7|nr:hypothetical protein [Streptomyces sp. NBC_01565]MCX4539430.1 hypothetical protein [Streptomyces sp. NBC_01565]
MGLIRDELLDRVAARTVEDPAATGRASRSAPRAECSLGVLSIGIGVRVSRGEPFAT